MFMHPRYHRLEIQKEYMVHYSNRCIDSLVPQLDRVLRSCFSELLGGWLLRRLVYSLAGLMLISNCEFAQSDSANLPGEESCPDLEILATDGVSVFEFKGGESGLYVQRDLDVKSASFGVSKFNSQMYQVETSMWFYPYTVRSGGVVEPRYTDQVRAAFEALGKACNQVLPKAFQLDTDFSGRLKILGRVVGESEKSVVFSSILFVYPREEVRKADIAVLIPTYTYQAYSSVFEPSLYKQPRRPDSPMSVSLNRPFLIRDSVHSPMKHEILDFLSQQDLDFDVFDDHYLSTNRDILGRYKLLVVAGHSEYWTHQMRQAIDNFVGDGGSILNLSGNLAWFKVVVRSDRLTVDKTNPLEGRESVSEWSGQYRFVDPIERVFGLSYQFAGYPVSRKLKSPEELVSLKSVSIPAPKEEFARLRDGIKLLPTNHPIFNEVPSDLIWLGSGSGLLDVEVDGAPLVPSLPSGPLAQADRDFEIDGEFAKSVMGEIEPLGVGWAVYGKQLRFVAYMVEVRPEIGRARILSFGSVGWQRAIFLDENVRQITYDAIRYLLRD